MGGHRGKSREVGAASVSPKVVHTLCLICGSLHPAEKLLPGTNLGTVITCIPSDPWDITLPPQLDLRTSPNDFLHFSYLGSPKGVENVIG